MNGTIAQLVALVCHGNSVIRGFPLLPFLKSNTTCQFCRSVKFIAGRTAADTQDQTFTLAGTPDDWLSKLPTREVLGLRLQQQPRNDPKISDRNSSGFVGGGRIWRIEGLRQNGASEFWQSCWEVLDRNAPDRRIWRVTYGLTELSATSELPQKNLFEIASALRSVLVDIYRFAEQQDLFRECFTDALRALDEPDADVGYHKDLCPAGAISTEAESILKSCQRAWVFGGMGSWNDISFDGEAQDTYEEVSERLFNTLNEAIAAAATSSCPK